MGDDRNGFPLNPGDPVMYIHDDDTAVPATVLRVVSESECLIQLDPSGPRPQWTWPPAVAISDQYDALMRQLPREVDVQDAFVVSSERLEHLGASPDLDDV